MGDYYQETEYGLCPSWALSLGYLGVAAGAVLSNWGSAVSWPLRVRGCSWQLAQRSGAGDGGKLGERGCIRDGQDGALPMCMLGKLELCLFLQRRADDVHKVGIIGASTCWPGL